MAEYTPELAELPELPRFDTAAESGYVADAAEVESVPEEMDEEEFGGYVARMLEDSIQYCDELSTDRVTASK